jgi:hypothetical protein
MPYQPPYNTEDQMSFERMKIITKAIAELCVLENDSARMNPQQQRRGRQQQQQHPSRMEKSPDFDLLSRSAQQFPPQQDPQWGGQSHQPPYSQQQRMPVPMPVWSQQRTKAQARPPIPNRLQQRPMQQHQMAQHPESPLPFYSLRSREENEQAMNQDLLGVRGEPHDETPSRLPDGGAATSSEGKDTSAVLVEYLKQFVATGDNVTSGDQAGKMVYTSIGSRLHSEGICKPCLFWNKGLCFKGEDCTFCHCAHSMESVQNIRPSKKTRVWLQRRTRQLDLAVKTLVAQNESSQPPDADDQS